MTDPAAAGELTTTPPQETSTAEPITEPTAARARRPRSLWADAWVDLRRRPLFLVSVVLVVLFVVMTAFPQVFTSTNPFRAELANSLRTPSTEAWFGYDLQGRDVFARTIYGARASMLVGVLAALVVTFIGGLMGILAGYFGGWLDVLVSRLGEIMLGLPYVLGAIIILATLAGASTNPSATRIMTIVILTMATLGWPIIFRVARSAALAVKSADYVQAARALGAGPVRIIFRHLLPNALAPIIVMGTITVGLYIGVEATLSYLGIGLRPPVLSWGVAMSDHKDYLRTAPHALLFPAGFLSIMVLSFVMLGDAVRDALDPRLR